MARECSSCNERIVTKNGTMICPFNCCGFELIDLAEYSLKEKIDEYCEAKISRQRGLDTVAKKFCLAKGLSIYTKMDLPSAIKYAALAVCPLIGQKRHGHQWCIARKTLEQWSQILLAASRKIADCKGGTFEELLKELDDLRIKGIGPLTVYDTALRIAAKLGCLPKENVYLHAGARIPGIPHTKPYLSITEFTQEMRKMTAYEIEDFLCIYKDHLSETDRILI